MLWAAANRSRRTPRRSPRAVERMWTRESGSSIQSTGTSPMRSPRRWAVTSNSVSKNQSSSSTSGRSCWAASRRSALKPHWASLKWPRSVNLSRQVVGPGDELALGPRTTCAPRARREPMATSRCPERSGATSGSSAGSEVERSTSMYATTGAMLVDQAARRAQSRGPCEAGAWPPRRARLPPGAGDVQGVVGAGVVHDRDERPEGEGLVEEGAESVIRWASCGASLYTGTTISTSMGTRRGSRRPRGRPGLSYLNVQNGPPASVKLALWIRCESRRLVEVGPSGEAASARDAEVLDEGLRRALGRHVVRGDCRSSGCARSRSCPGPVRRWP